MIFNKHREADIIGTVTKNRANNKMIVLEENERCHYDQAYL